MELIYRTIDGKEFDNEIEAVHHETCLKDGLMMWDKDGERTDNSLDAYLVYCATVRAADYFDALSNELQGTIDEFTSTNRVGYHVWDAANANYKRIPDDIVQLLVKAAADVKEKEEQ